MQKAETNSIGIEHQLRNLHDGTPVCFKLLIPEPGTSEAIVVASCPIEPQCRPRWADSIPVGQKELQFLFRRFILPQETLDCDAEYGVIRVRPPAAMAVSIPASGAAARQRFGQDS